MEVKIPFGLLDALFLPKITKRIVTYSRTEPSYEIQTLLFKKSYLALAPHQTFFATETQRARKLSKDSEPSSFQANTKYRYCNGRFDSTRRDYRRKN